METERRSAEQLAMESRVASKKASVPMDTYDLAGYDSECLGKHVMTVSIKGYEMPVWRAIEKFLWVKDQDTDSFVPFRLRFAQKMLYRELLEQSLHGKPMRQDILKARQLGFSTLIAAIVFITAAFRPNTKCIIMADIEEHASNIFEIYQNFYLNLDRSLPAYEEIREFETENPGKRHPASIKPVIGKKRAGKRIDWTNGSSIQVIVVGENAGRSGSYTIVHSSETAFQPSLKATNRALFKCVSINNPASMIFIETTANGFNDYKKMWDEHVSKNGVFNALFVPWFKNPDYRYKVPDTGLPNLEPWIYRKWQAHPELTEEQIMWYWMRFSEDLDEEGMLQEFPWDPSDAFISSGKSIFDQKKLSERLDLLMSKGVYWETGFFTCQFSVSPDGKEIDVRDIAYKVTDSGNWKVFQRPQKDRHYVVLCDPTKGFNHDFSAIQVLDQNTGTQLAVFNAKANLEDVAYQIHCVHVYYNSALISVENNTGMFIIDMLVKMGDTDSLYVDQSMVGQDFTEGVSHRFGHNTNVGTRDVYIANFEQAFRTSPEIVNDIETLQQMETFQLVQTKTGKMKAMGNSTTAHDDLVMAYAPFWSVRQQGEFDFQRETQGSNEKQFVIRSTDDMDAYLRYRRRHSEKDKVRNVTGISW